MLASSKTLAPPSIRACRHGLKRAHWPTRRICCRQLSTFRPLEVARRTPDFNAGFTGSYDPTVDSGRGPMFSKTNFGVPQFYPRDLKKRVDQYVVGQDRAKKTICSTLFNHYQNLRRRHQHEHEERSTQERLTRQRLARDREVHQRRRDTHPVEGQPAASGNAEWSATDGTYQHDFSGHQDSVRPLDDNDDFKDDSLDCLYAAEDTSKPVHVKVDKSNLLLIGPTGVGKTYILETLSKKIQVPFSICDCNSLTQAGYIGQDVETCIERLLMEANYDIKAAERGIVVLDEFDKLARKESPTGRDVGGEGVQQALLKMVEGAKVTVNVKDTRSSRSTPPITANFGSSGPSSSPQPAPPGGKVEQYTIDTTNILFIFCGAFVGLDKAVVQRVAKPSLGFGFIPELIGRLHNICALSPLSKDDLLRILTEPRNSLVAQYTALFETYPSRLYITDKALYAIAERAAASETGARGLKMEMERVLAEPIFDAPTPYVLVSEGCVKGTEKASYWGKDGRFELDRRLEEEEVRGPSSSSTPHAPIERQRQAGQSGG
ncbi:Clp protease, ATP-binding subunit ClpX [Ophiocordyceps sinensis CO18]|uniref:Clp protease, ATP-binding subunit ClpX n=1 Tax=Ophiocordyceps sinensis (strain Co18 / CGMCC 3.14243) TaxID=911162 RepID=T5AQQ5_OPHSC|nr:Clp protease, ATP-binding subunit ClpX [Ophiocordyceps sinensis CO18]